MIDFLRGVFCLDHFRAIAAAPWFGALLGALIGGLFSLLATRWTLSRGFKNQRRILDGEYERNIRGAAWAMITEMAENLARLKVVEELARSEAPIAHIIPNLVVSRHVFDTQIPLLAPRLKMSALRAITASYAGISILLAILHGKWEPLPHPSYATNQDKEGLKHAKQDFEKSLRTAAAELLTEDERTAAGLHIEGPDWKI